MRIIILGANGLIGSTMYRVLSSKESLQVFGTIREDSLRLQFSHKFQSNLLSNVDLLNHDALVHLLLKSRPDVIINCAGITKHLPNSSDPLVVLPINALMPHRVAKLCEMTGARFIHVSTDCVFLGSRGNYRESDQPDARDVYGQSKILGEVIVGNSLTIRTSTLGHELSSSHGLLNWFLNQKGGCRGYRNAVFSGLPTVVLAQVIRDFILPNDSLHGLMHVSAQSINKFDLLQLIATTYGKVIDIQPDDSVEIDRSLDGSLFSKATGFIAPEWPDLIRIMFENR